MPKVETYRTRAGEPRWKVRYTDPHNGKQTSRTFTIQHEAKGFAAQLSRHGAARVLADEEDANRTEATLDEWAARHLESLTGITDGTRLTYERIYRRVWSPLLGSMVLTMIDRESLGRALNKVTGSDKTIKNAWGVLSSMLKAAYQDGLIGRNPAVGVRMPRSTEHESTRHRYLTHDEFARLYDEMPEHYKPLLLTLIGTGIRWGEAAALFPSDFDLDTSPPVVRIVRAEKMNPGTSTKSLGPPKTKAGRRTISLPAEVVEAVRPLVAAGGKRVFLAEAGGPLRHQNFWTYVWRPAVKRAGLEPPPRIHDLRHSHVAWLIAANVQGGLATIQARLGHEKITTTIDTYGGLLPDVQRAAADAAGVALRGIGLPQIEG